MPSQPLKSIKVTDGEHEIAEEIHRERGVPRGVAIGAALRAFRKLPRKTQDSHIQQTVADRNRQPEPTAA
jgi:hypothetical protein